MSDEIRLANSVIERTQELIESLEHQIEIMRSTDGVTFSVGISHTLKYAHKDIRSLIGDSGLDGRFRKGRRRNHVVS
jgi:hypothetical protein